MILLNTNLHILAFFWGTAAASMVVAVAVAVTLAGAALALFVVSRNVHFPRFRFFGTSLR